MKIQPNTKLVMIGDSITDCGRFETGDGLGHGYVRFVAEALREHDIQVINTGVSGNTVRDLKVRWQRDVLDKNPDWLSVMIGINDVWRQIDNWEPQENWILLDEYEQTLDALLATVDLAVPELILMAPYVLELDLADAMRVKMGLYAQVVRKLADKYDALFIDTQAAFDAFFQTHATTEISSDRVHMNDVGHQILADIFLEAIS